MYRLKSCCISDIGKRRENNQDNFLCGGCCMEMNTRHRQFYDEVLLKKPYFVGIFDGMGGEQCGEHAAFLSAQTVLASDLRKNTAEEIAELCRTANKNVFDYARENKLRSTGTTVAALVFSERTANMLNVGDSKVFLLYRRKMSQISVDDVSVSVMGRKPPLSQCIGMDTEECRVTPHIRPIKLRNGMRFLICSDGLTDMVNTDVIRSIVEAAGDVTEAAEALTAKALENGGTDNVTVIVSELKRKKFFERGEK